ncbi:MAG: DUF3552 domain-containing protein, partial [Clostridia bacterium]|nr:DUF3552 domain-containing protein [Clostridia bacterium]
MNLGLAIGLIVAALAVGAAIGFLIRRFVAEKKIGSAEAEAKRILTDCAQQAEAIKKEKLMEAKEEILRLRNETEAELKERRAEVTRMERRLIQKEENLEAKVEALDRKNEMLEEKLRANDALRAEITAALAEQQHVLEALAGLTAEEAKEELIERVEGEIKHELAQRLDELEAQFKDEAETKARNILSLAIQRCATDHVA